MNIVKRFNLLALFLSGLTSLGEQKPKPNQQKNSLLQSDYKTIQIKHFNLNVEANEKTVGLLFV